ncbi:hypothetical protein K2X30_08525 [bacterium]|jgi:hypothetical protein|nr:hypothetical protein [bacterium]
MKRVALATAVLFSVITFVSEKNIYAAMGEADAGSTEAPPKDPNTNDPRKKNAPEAKTKVVQLKDVKQWGKFLPPLVDALEGLRKLDLDKEEFQDYEDFYLRVMAFKKILEEGEPPFSGRARGYLYVAISAYFELEKSEGYKEDTQNTYADDRTQRAKSLKVATERMMEFLVGDKQVTKINGQYKINVASGEAIVRNLSESLIGISKEVMSEIVATQIDPDFADSEFKLGLQWMVGVVMYIRDTLKGGDGSRAVDQQTAKLIDWYDVWASQPESENGKNYFEEYMKKFEAAAKASKDRKAKFMDLAGKMEHLNALFVTIKNHVQYGVGHRDRTFADLKAELAKGQTK